MTAGSINRFWLRPVFSRSRPQRKRPSAWAVWDAATGQLVGDEMQIDSASDWDALKQQLRMIRSRHGESLREPMIFPQGSWKPPY